MWLWVDDSYPFVRLMKSCSQQLRIHPAIGENHTSLPWIMKLSFIAYPIGLPNCTWDEATDQLAHGMLLAIMMIITRIGHNHLTQPPTKIEHIPSHWIQTSFLQVNWVPSPVHTPTMHIVTLTHNVAILRSKGEVADDLWVSTVTSTFHLFEWSAPISVHVYTYNSSNVQDTCLLSHGMPTHTYGGGSVHQ